MAIGEGRKTAEKTRAEVAESQRATRARKKVKASAIRIAQNSSTALAKVKPDDDADENVEKRPPPLPTRVFVDDGKGGLRQASHAIIA